MAEVVTLKDIAAKLGVSVVTISNALSGKKGVSDSVRTQVLETAKDMGYEVKKYDNIKKKGAKIGVIVSERYLGMGTSFYWSIYQQIAYAVFRNNSVTMLEVLDRQMEADGKLPTILGEKQVDGLIVLGWVQKEYARKIVNSTSMPVVLMDFWDDELDCDAILSNNYLGTYQMTRQLLKQGHREIAFLGNIKANGNIMDRYLGYQKALLEWGIPVREEWLISDRNAETGDMAVELPEKMPTAFACNSDLAASLLLDKLEEAGYSVPEDISIVGFDNFLFDHPFAEKITTYDVDIKAMAAICVKTILKKISGSDKRLGVRIIDGHIVHRSSVKTIL